MEKQSSIDSAELSRRSEELIRAASNRYRVVVQVANRAKRRRYEDFDNMDEQLMKPVIRAVVEMSDELMQPEIISDLSTPVAETRGF
ncbi:MAG: DNA-directed RNA polymerase subunit omega [Okeania sp. SIO3B5]|uniref:DNA-directed RNA polymerase subunit omega n=1 Tax=Okeania sp. SIO3B5 TaxID=2607811 RepID=UPI0013FFD6E3|nr:DNA-directed RNA polymerase subunit omega [Okeania sp. SIO3B5]NEO55843.1 DNA-directed RNA polymerase subunit omega [Okeania sp. SIO3B5]